MNIIDITSVVGVKIAERIQAISMAYFLFEDKKLEEAKPNLDNKKIINGYSKIFPKLNIREVKKPRVSLMLGRAVIDSEEYSFIKTSNANGATKKKQNEAPTKNNKEPITIITKDTIFSFSYNAGLTKLHAS